MDHSITSLAFNSFINACLFVHFRSRKFPDFESLFYQHLEGGDIPAEAKSIVTEDMLTGDAEVKGAPSVRTPLFVS